MTLQLVLPLPELTGKRCSTCKETKPVTEFVRNRYRPDGLQNSCKVCTREHNRRNREKYPEKKLAEVDRWRKANPDKVRGYNRRWKEANPERHREITRIWYAANPEKARETARRWKEANPERTQDLRRRWREENPEKHREHNRRWREKNPDQERLWREKNPEKARANGHRRRARKQANGIFAVTDKDLRRIYGSPCWACGATERITLDHVVPIARGGHHSIGNALPLCLSCNCSKHTRLLSEWRYRDQLAKRKAA
jgi:hypothetical protein